jgi:hypothetical protein
VPTDLYDVSLPGPHARVVSSREFAVRRQAMELCRQDPDLFCSVVRDCDRREREGTDPVDALEQALDVVGIRVRRIDRVDYRR